MVRRHSLGQNVPLPRRPHLSVPRTDREGPPVASPTTSSRLRGTSPPSRRREGASTPKKLSVRPPVRPERGRVGTRDRPDGDVRRHGDQLRRRPVPPRYPSLPAVPTPVRIRAAQQPSATDATRFTCDSTRTVTVLQAANGAANGHHTTFGRLPPLHGNEGGRRGSEEAQVLGAREHSLPRGGRPV